MDPQIDARRWFGAASDAAVSLVARVPDDAWERPGLGEWTVRELVAHLLRAWTTVRDYLGEPRPADGTPLLTAAAYLAQGLLLPGIHEGVADRARAEVGSLGADPAAAVRAVAGAARAVVDAEAGDRLLPTRIGPMRLDDYLRTRALELTLHGLDVCRATGLPVPADLEACTVPALVLLAEVAGERGLATDLVEALGGRAVLAPGFTLLG
ncbi:maleylpyruvate isomerase N-terminal domain-containing protein [Phycicoccus sp.]|uniref:maleylpyruvate isomerase family mycothiol-dependent enzyme n=1 Tax=Phycicoccus sp. TaxID=1902410 RepID=UPI002C5F0033|nr:maleylpyruvate isomerase N-terminal domain-containing protein [Phycicoccus sp.]HMM96412.1 maleylpyruvate isomerase N-terminal domain-containing protein [Phycicoccus sp.]